MKSIRTLAREPVVLWWGIFDNELYIQHGDKRYGPYAPVGGPIPLYRYRSFKKSPTQERADRIEALAEQLALPRAALEGNPRAALLIRSTEVPVTMFTDPDPFQEFAYANVLAVVLQTLRISDEVTGSHPRHAFHRAESRAGPSSHSAFYEMAKRRAQWGCFAPPSHAF